MTGADTRNSGGYGNGIRKTVDYLPKLAAFALRRFGSARWALLLALIGVLLEYATLTIMLPLSGASGGSSSRGAMVVGFWRSVAVTVGLPDSARSWLWLFMVLLGLRIIAGFGQYSLNVYVGKRIMSFVCNQAFERVVVHEPLRLIYQRSIGHYLAMAGDEAQRVGHIFFNLVQLVSSLLAASIGLIVLLLLSPPAFQLTCLFLVLTALALFAALGSIMRTNKESTRLNRQVSSTFVEAINGIRSIRSMAGEEFVAGRFTGFIKRYTHTLFILEAFAQATKAVPAIILVVIGLVALFPRAGFFGEVPPVFFFAVIAMLIRVLAFLGAAVAAGGRLIADVQVAFDLNEVIGVTTDAGQPVRRTSVTGVQHIAFENLVCGYENNPAVLSGASGRLNAGQCYALVGRSGSGKSTLADVLLGLLAPTEGELSVNDVPYRALNMNSLRRKVVLVEQQTQIFSGTLRENISFGLVSGDAEIQQAVEAAGLREFLGALPHGLESRLDYQGANLSGGQRQRIGLARAIIRQPDVLILDEATSALDRQTRDTVLRNLREMFRTRILVFITHDNDVVRSADEIWHMKKGRIEVEAGGVVA